jgi:hypothetical protein
LTSGRRLIAVTIPLIASVGTLLTEYEIGAGTGGVRLTEGVAMGVILVVVVAAQTGWLRRPSSATASTVVPD